MKQTFATLAASLTLLSLQAADTYHVYFGCYTNAKSGSKGIYVSKFAPATGELSDPVLAVETGSPSFLSIHPDGTKLYAVGEMATPGQKGGGVSAFSIHQPDGKLTLINQVSSVGAGPCHVSTDKTGRMLMIANYGGGSVASYAIDEKGALSEAKSFIQHEGSSVNPKRQAGPHAHSFNVSPDNRFGFACDLGLDKVLIYRLDPSRGTLASHGHATVPAGGGPRHLAFHPSGRFVFVNNEMLMSATSFAYDADQGALTEIETVSTLPEVDRGNTGYSTAETVAHPNGRFVYVSNRTHDTLAVFSCDPATGRLKLIQNAPVEGRIPRNFNLDPTGRWMIIAHQDSNTAALFKVDAETGKLEFTGRKVSVGGAVCVRFLAVSEAK